MIPPIVARVTRSALSVALGGTLFMGAPASTPVTSVPAFAHPFTAVERAEYDVRY